MSSVDLEKETVDQFPPAAATKPKPAPKRDRVPRPALPSVAEFIAKIEKHRLVPAAILAAIRSRTRTRDDLDVVEFARNLVESGHLTWWQVDRLLTGRGGFTVGKYTLVDKVGAGGMSVVLKAREPGRDSFVAIKVLSRANLRRPEAVKRFSREVEAAFALDDEHIVRPLASDCIRGVPFLVMEYVEGKDLYSLVKQRGPLPVEWACEFCRQAAMGLEHAFQMGLVHRDVKPDNLLLTRRSPEDPLTIKISDFGLARFTSETPESEALTAANQVFGTPDFISPEQARNARSADIRSDIFSLGCTLFYLLTGRLPFKGKSVMEKLTSRLLDDAPLVSTLRPEVPPELETLLARMLARKPAKRPQTPGEVAEGLKPFAATTAGTTPTTAPGVSAVLRQDPQRAPAEPAPSEVALEKFLSQLDDEPLRAQSTAAEPPPPAGGWPWPAVAAVAAAVVMIVLLAVLNL